MALSKDSVAIAIDILGSVMGQELPAYVEVINDASIATPNIIILNDPNPDGGVDSVYVNIENLTENQLELFEERATEIPNRSLIKKSKTVTVLGWI